VTNHGFTLLINQTYGLTFAANNNAVAVNIPCTLAAATWYHVAISNTGTSLFAGIDGVVSETSISFSVGNYANQVIIGALNNGVSEFFSGYIQDVRVTKGVARYTSNFTPPERLIKTLSGSVKDDTNANAERTVVAFPRLTPTKQVQSVVSNASTGLWSIDVPDTEHAVICLDDAAGTQYNDLAYGRVTPA
jgi:hypothetical protein